MRNEIPNRLNTFIKLAIELGSGGFLVEVGDASFSNACHRLYPGERDLFQPRFQKVARIRYETRPLVLQLRLIACFIVRSHRGSLVGSPP